MSKIFKPDFKIFSTSSGVYQFLTASGVVLYVGKAKNLRNRLKSYYNKDHGRGARIDLMLGEAQSIKTIQTDSEFEAVLLEAELSNKL
jgi:excinuclease ABC subunit C